VDLQAKDGFTPLHIAAEHGRASATELLISARCNLDLQDKAGRT
jgi:ankyrin repeat protein